MDEPLEMLLYVALRTHCTNDIDLASIDSNQALVVPRDHNPDDDHRQFRHMVRGLLENMD